MPSSQQQKKPVGPGGANGLALATKKVPEERAIAHCTTIACNVVLAEPMLLASKCLQPDVGRKFMAVAMR